MVAPSYTQDNITVKQSESDVRTIDNDLLLGMPTGRSWYAGRYDEFKDIFLGGNDGYTKITLANGLSFLNLSLLVGDGEWVDSTSLIYLNYMLKDGGHVVLHGNYAFNDQVLPVSFLGGGFDEVWLSSTTEINKLPGDGSYQGLVIDNIKATAGPPACYRLVISQRLDRAFRGYECQTKNSVTFFFCSS